MAVETLGFIQPQQADTGVGFSDTIWRDCPLSALREGTVPGSVFECDFNGFKTAANVNAAEAYWSDGTTLFGDNGAAVADAGEAGGAITIGSDGDNEGVVMREAVTAYKISRASYKFWFEARIKTSTIADTKHNIFLGLMDSTAVTAIVPITALGALADVNLVGFRRTEAASGGALLDTVYKANGVTAVTVQAGAVTLVPDTYVKLAMKYSPFVDPFNYGSASGTNDGFGKFKYTFYANGIALSTFKQIPSADGTDFPNDIFMSFVFGVLNATGTTPGTSTIDKVRVAQVFQP